MSEFPAIDQLARVPGLHGKRVRIWAAVVLSIVSLLGIQAAVPSWQLLPDLTGLGPGVILAIILSVGLATLATARRQLRYRRGHIIAVGAVAAFNKGLSGGGYGPLVTAGQVVSGVSAKSAVAITSIAEAFTCIVGLLAYMVIHGGLDFALAIPLTAGAALSVPMATLTVRRLPESVMRCSVGVVTCLLAILTFTKLIW